MLAVITGQYVERVVCADRGVLGPVEERHVGDGVDLRACR